MHSYTNHLEYHFPQQPPPVYYVPDRICTPINLNGFAPGSLTSSPTITSPSGSPRSPPYDESNANNGFNEYSFDPVLKRRLSNVEEPKTYKRSCATSHGFSQLDMLSYISLRSETPKFLQSEQTYTIYQPQMVSGISVHSSQLLDSVYGGRVVVSRKRKPLQTDAESHITTPATKKPKQAQGRPYSAEMVVDLIFPASLDELFACLCVKGNPPVTHRVKLQTDCQQPSDKQGTPVFGNSQDMVRYFTGSTEFSIVTAFRQSSMDKSPFKKGTCPVVKFNISPVSDYSVEYLKRMAYPRYKACMKMYLIPQVFKADSTTSPIAHTFYTSAAMYLQDQESRLAAGLGHDSKSRIFHSPNYPDLPNCVYDKEFRIKENTKTALNYILN